MPGSDDISRLAAIQVRQHQGGKAERLRQQRGLAASAIGKACGVSASLIYEWERGTLMPTTQQSLAWLTALYELTPNPATVMARAAAADLEAAKAGDQAPEVVEW